MKSCREIFSGDVQIPSLFKLMVSGYLFQETLAYSVIFNQLYLFIEFLLFGNYQFWEGCSFGMNTVSVCIFMFLIQFSW